MYQGLIFHTILSFAGALMVYAITFSIYKRKNSSKPFAHPFLTLFLPVALSLLMARYGSKALVMFVVVPLYLLSIFAYPILSSLVLVRIPSQGRKLWFIFTLGILSCVIYTIVFAWVIGSRGPITEANL